MTEREVILAIDQGTSSTRAVLYDRDLEVLASARRPLRMTNPAPGWSEQSPTEILASVVESVAEVLGQLPPYARVVAAGLANQGETVVAWDATTGRPLAPAVSWECRRSEPIVVALAAAGHGPAIRASTGLPLDAYFSAGKMAWLQQNVDAVASARRAGRLRLGTVDAWLTQRLAGRAITDVSTASRTQLMDLGTLSWDPWLLECFGIDETCLPRIGPTVGRLGTLRHPSWPVSLAFTAAICDQQAALAGDAGLEVGSTQGNLRHRGVRARQRRRPTTSGQPLGGLRGVAAR